MKYLVLLIYNENVEYERLMYEEHTQYFSTKENFITHYFIVFREHQKEEIEINYNIMSFKGKESFTPGILDKTIKAIKYINDILNLEYDILIRANTSTVINYDKLNNIITSNNLNSYDYFSFNVHKIAWVDISRGVMPYHAGTIYAQGTNIFINRNTVNLLLANIDKINFNIIDDVSIGLTLKLLGIYVKFITCNNGELKIISFEELQNISNNNLQLIYKNNLFYKDHNEKYNISHKIDYTDNNTIFYRNKTEHNRIIDVENIKNIYKNIKKIGSTAP